LTSSAGDPGDDRVADQRGNCGRRAFAAKSPHLAERARQGGKRHLSAKAKPLFLRSPGGRVAAGDCRKHGYSPALPVNHWRYKALRTLALHWSGQGFPSPACHPDTT
jgi:choline dehydrogenase-like flavoprotein